MDSFDYDIIIVGSGLYGAVTAYRARQKGLKCLVLERRDDIGGNVRDKMIDGINVHLYGAHIFHTDNEHVWSFVQHFSDFNNYIHTVLAHIDGKYYHMPVNLMTFHEIFGAKRPQDISDIMTAERRNEYYSYPKNLEQKAVSLIGRTVYELLVKGYTEKQWGCAATELPAEIIERLPVRTTFDSRYFGDRFQGIPVNGYYSMIRRMLDGVEFITGVDFCKERYYWLDRARRIIYTGMIDELMDYCFGSLDYRGLEFRTERVEVSDYQGMAVINETLSDVPYTRTIEHKHFNLMQEHLPYTIITREYPSVWHPGCEAYYPINNSRNSRLYARYRDVASRIFPNIIFGGRLGEYRYYDMDDVILAALSLEL